MAKEAAPRLGEFTPQALANTAWAFATAGVPAPTLFAAVAKEAEPRLGEVNEQGLSNTAWAFAKAGVQCINRRCAAETAVGRSCSCGVFGDGVVPLEWV